LLDILFRINNYMIPGHSLEEGGYSDKKALEGTGLPTVSPFDGIGESQLGIHEQ
jgi:hypothetical protein